MLVRNLAALVTMIVGSVVHAHTYVPYPKRIVKRIWNVVQSNSTGLLVCTL